MSKLRIGMAALTLATTLGIALLPASCYTFPSNPYQNGSGSCVRTGDCKECESDDKCPGPPDPRCGAGRCVDNSCEIEIFEGLTLESQHSGDCATLVCTAEGTVEPIIDTSDIPLDGNVCTYDLCKYDYPYHEKYANATPCPGKELDVCVDSECVDCLLGLEAFECPDGLQCILSYCAPATCADDLVNEQETDLDCGGPECPPCIAKQKCLQGRDCKSGVCVAQVCQQPTRTDGVKNGLETGVDCGSLEGPAHQCLDGEGCKSSYDCQSRVCYDGVCQAPKCTDAVKNGLELEKDCGGDCPPCPD